MSICGCCKDATTSLLGQIRAKAHCWACFCTYVISLRFTPLYLREWARRLALKLEWNLYLTSLTTKDDQVAMKLAPCCFTKKHSTNFSVVISDVSGFWLAFLVFLSFYFSDLLWCLPIQCILLHNPQILFWSYNILRLQHGFENNQLMVLFHRSFLQVDMVMTTNCDTRILMPLELNF